MKPVVLRTSPVGSNPKNGGSNNKRLYSSFNVSLKMEIVTTNFSVIV